MPAFLFFSAAKALPLSPAVVVSPSACSSGLDLGSEYCAIFIFFFFGEDPLYNRAHFLFFYKKAPAPFRQFVHFLDLFAALLVLFPLLLDELFHYFFPEHFCSASRDTSNHDGTKPCRECEELSLRLYLGHLH